MKLKNRYLMLIIMFISIFLLSACEISPTLLVGSEVEGYLILDGQPTTEDISFEIETSGNKVTFSDEELKRLNEVEDLLNDFLNSPSKIEEIFNESIDTNSVNSTQEEIDNAKKFLDLILGVYEYDKKVKNELSIDAEFKYKFIYDLATKEGDTYNIPRIHYIQINSIPDKIPDFSTYAVDAVNSIYESMQLFMELSGFKGEGSYNVESDVTEVERNQQIYEIENDYKKGYEFLLENEGKYIVTEVNIQSFTEEELDELTGTKQLESIFEIQGYENKIDLSTSTDITISERIDKKINSLDDTFNELEKKINVLSERGNLNSEENELLNKLRRIYYIRFNEKDFLNPNSTEVFGEVLTSVVNDDGTYQIIVRDEANVSLNEFHIEKEIQVGSKIRIVSNETEVVFKILNNEIKSSDEFSEWAEDSIQVLYDKYILEKSDFKDYTKPITRRDFSKLMIRFEERYMKNEISIGQSPFDDTVDKYVVKAYSRKMINGISDSEFNPHGDLTREQAATIISRYLPEDIEYVYDSVNYFDKDEISEYAKSHVNVVSNIGIMQGYDSMFHPKEKLTVQQAVKLIDNLIKLDF